MQRALIVAALLLMFGPGRAGAAEQRTFEAGSLILPMDLSYQDHGLLQAYGLVFQLLRQGVTVYWAIDPAKTWHAAACDTAGQECAWDCGAEGSGVKCAYPTASPDFYAPAKVVWDGEGLLQPGDAVARHGYRGGPFVIDAAERDAALAIIGAWNDQARWADAPWAARTVFQVVTVHEATEAFGAPVRKVMIAAPSIAVFSDGNEDIATGYLRAAGIPQSNGQEFPAGTCAAGNCGPGTSNPDMLTVPSVMGDMGTCAQPVLDHQNGALFAADGVPAYCQIMSMHWNVTDRETVECGGAACPATQAACGTKAITYHGHEVVAEVRRFLQYPTHFFAECQAVNAYENAVPNPAWPFLDDAGRDGHYLTTTGTPPDCPCTDADFSCITGGCDQGGRDCCQPKNIKEQGAGFLIADQPASDTLKILRPDVPYNQLDGAFATTGGSEPAYNLSDVLGTEYKSGREVTFITGPNGPGDQDLWMTGYLEGECDIGTDDTQHNPGECTMGKVSYLGGHSYKTAVPISQNPGSQGARLFLNALFEADCVTSVGAPAIALQLTGRARLGAKSFPAETRVTASYRNLGTAAALEASLNVTAPTQVIIAEVETGGVIDAAGASWALGSIGGQFGLPQDPLALGSRWAQLRFAAYGTYRIAAGLAYRVGVSARQAPEAALEITVLPDADGDTVADEDDPSPNDPARCGDSDNDTCDDCAVANQADPNNDGPDQDGDGICDKGETLADGGNGDGGIGGGKSGGCGCGAGGAGGAGGFWLVLLAAALRWRRLTI